MKALQISAYQNAKKLCYHAPVLKPWQQGGYGM